MGHRCSNSCTSANASMPDTDGEATYDEQRRHQECARTDQRATSSSDRTGYGDERGGTRAAGARRWGRGTQSTQGVDQRTCKMLFSQPLRRGDPILLSLIDITHSLSCRALHFYDGNAVVVSFNDRLSPTAHPSFCSRVVNAPSYLQKPTIRSLDNHFSFSFHTFSNQYH